MDLESYVEEFILRLEKKWNITDEEISLKSMFYKHFQNLIREEKDLHGKLKFNLSYRFLKNNKEWLLS